MSSKLINDFIKSQEAVHKPALRVKFDRDSLLRVAKRAEDYFKQWDCDCRLGRVCILHDLQAAIAAAEEK